MARVLLLIYLAATPLVVLLVHMAASRIAEASGRAASRQVVCAGSIAAGYVPLSVFLFYIVPAAGAGALSTVIYAFVVYGVLGYCYFHVFNMSETARRIRILYDVWSLGSPGVSEIESGYDVGDVLSVRMERLEASGQIALASGRYVIAGRTILYAARLLSFWGGVIGVAIMGGEPVKGGQGQGKA